MREQFQQVQQIIEQEGNSPIQSQFDSTDIGQYWEDWDVSSDNVSITGIPGLFFIEDIVVQNQSSSSVDLPEEIPDLSAQYNLISQSFPKVTNSLYQMQNYMAFQCACANHTGMGIGFGFETSFSSPFMSPFFQNMSQPWLQNPFDSFSGFGMNPFMPWITFQEKDHKDHDHCEKNSCGGHFDKNGVCEKCGEKKPEKKSTIWGS